MDIGDAGCLAGEAREFEIMRGKQREGADFGGNERGAGPRQRQSVEGAGAAADFVHEHQAPGRGVIEDIGRLGHFEHEGRAAAREIVGRADAGEYAIDGS